MLKVQDLEELKAYLRERCLKDQQRISSGKKETIGPRLEQNKKQALSLPKYRFDPCARQEAKPVKENQKRSENRSLSMQCVTQNISLRADYGHGFNNVPFSQSSDRMRLGLVW